MTEAYEKIFVGWSNPFHHHTSGFKIGVEVAEPGSYPDNLEDLPEQATHKKTSDPEGTSIYGTAEIMEDHYYHDDKYYHYPLVLFQCLQKL